MQHSEAQMQVQQTSHQYPFCARHSQNYITVLGHLLWLIRIHRHTLSPPIRPSLGREDTLRSQAAVSAGQGEAGRVPSCTLSSGSCPAMCACSNGIVDCRGKGLTAIPANLPETMTEM